jgi:hypothetical protein
MQNAWACSTGNPSSVIEVAASVVSAAGTAGGSLEPRWQQADPLRHEVSGISWRYALHAKQPGKS